MNIQIEGGRYICLGDGEYGGIGSAVVTGVTVVAADAFGREHTPAAAEVVWMYRPRRDRGGGPKNSSLWGLWDGS